jgi:mannose-6-phosphate isomerase
MFQLKGKVQYYSWGGYDFIPNLLNLPNKDQKPYAEYWLGAHPSQSAVLDVDGREVPLHDHIRDNAAGALGPRTARAFGSLPFLLKVLDVRQMLSIQVHPNLAQGRDGFARENDAGIAPGAPHRNYKDANHKPELMVALDDFWLLHGFKPEAKLIETLSSVPELKPLLPRFESGGYKGLFEYVMEPGRKDTEDLLNAIRGRVVPAYEAGTLQRSSPDFWAARALQTFCAGGTTDKGIFSIYFFNLLHVRKGEGLFQDAGLPHAYLEGRNIEIMANSDNVLRAGLTDKHVDVPELLALVRFEPTVPAIIPASDREVVTYDSPAAEFELRKYELKDGSRQDVPVSEATIFLLMEGRATLTSGDATLPLPAGGAAFCAPGEHVRLEAGADAVVFVATVPTDKN